MLMVVPNGNTNLEIDLGIPSLLSAIWIVFGRTADEELVENAKTSNSWIDRKNTIGLVFVKNKKSTD